VTLHDTARALSHVIDLNTKNLGDGLFNVGGECSMRIIDIAHEIADRCAAVLGFVPELQRPHGDDTKSGQSYEYDIKKIKATGFSPEGSRQTEIDNTLRLCQMAFGATP